MVWDNSDIPASVFGVVSVAVRLVGVSADEKEMLCKTDAASFTGLGHMKVSKLHGLFSKLGLVKQ